MKMKEINVRQICLFFIALTPLSKIFMLPSIMAGYVKEDLWILGLIHTCLDVLTVAVLVAAAKKFGSKNFYSLLSDNFGEVVARVIYGFYVVFFLLKAFTPLIEQETYLELTLYETLPTKFVFLPFFIVSFYLALKPLRAIGRLSDVIWFTTIFSFALLFAIAFIKIDFASILPIGASGFKNIAKSSYFITPWYGDAVYMLFFIGEFDYEKKPLPKIVLSYGITSLLLLLFYISFYGTFTSIAERQILAITEVSNYNSVISNIERFDYLAIFGILFSNVINLAVPLYFAAQCLQKVLRFKNKIFPSVIVTVQALLAVVFLKEFSYELHFIVERYFSVFFLLMGNVLPALVTLLPARRKHEVSKV